MGVAFDLRTLMQFVATQESGLTQYQDHPDY